MEMEKKKSITTEQLKRIAALPYNLFFEREINGIRRKYAIPEDASEAKNWFKNLLREYRKSTFAFIFKLRSEHLPYDIIRLPHDLPAFEMHLEEDLQHELAIGAGEMRTLRETEVPLERDILLLLRRFDLPQALYFMVLQYALTHDSSWIQLLHIRSEAHCLFGMETGEIALRVTVTGLYPWTTREEWDDLWEGTVKDSLEDLDAFLCGREFHRKRSLQEALYRRFKRWYQSYQSSLDRQMKRWSEWFQLVEIEGMPIGEALRQWEESHPEQVPAKGIDESTVSKAIGEFRKIITPIPKKDLNF